MKLFFNINDIIYQYDNKTESLKKNHDLNDCKGGTCLIMNNSKSMDNKNLFNSHYQIGTKKEYIKKDLDRELDRYVYTQVEDDNSIFVFGVSLSKYLYLIDDCQFAKVYSLDYLFYKMGKSINGIISEDIMMLDDYSKKDTYISNYLLGVNHSLHYIGLSSNIYFNNLERMIEKGEKVKVFSFSQKITNQIKKSGFGDIIIDIEELFQIIKANPDMYIIDNVSGRYKKQILHKYMYIGDIALIGIAVLLGYFYLINLSYGGSNLKQIEKQEAIIAQYESKIKSLNTQLPNVHFKNYNIDSIKDQLSFIGKYEPEKIYYTFESGNNDLEANFILNNIDNIEEIIQYFNDNKIKYTYNKVKKFSFLFKIKLKVNYE